MNLARTSFFDFTITSGDPKDIIQSALDSKTASLINTINANAFNVAVADDAFR